MKKNLIAAAILLVTAISARAAEVDVSFEEQNDLPLVFVNVVVRAGAVSDPAGRSGLTNFLGEAMLRGTTHKTKEELDLALDQIGAHIAVDTRQESMIFRGAVLSRELDTFLDLFADVLSHPRFEAKEIEKLRSEFVSGLLEELGQDRTIAAKQFQRFFFGSHPYANYVMGKQNDLKAITRADLESHYKKIFSRSNLFIVGSGDAASGKIRDWFAKIATGLEHGDSLKEVSDPVQPHGKRLCIVDKPDRTQTQIYVGQKGISIKDPRYFAFYVGNYAFGGGSFNSRLMKEVRVKRGWSYGASSSMSSGTQAKAWSSFLFPAEKDTPQALGLVVSMIDDLRKTGLTLEEFSFSKESLINSSGFMFNTPKKRAENKILEKILSLPDGFMNSFGKRIALVTRDETNRALAEILVPENSSVLVLGTAKKIKADVAKSCGVSDSQVSVVPYDAD